MRRLKLSHVIATTSGVALTALAVGIYAWSGAKPALAEPASLIINADPISWDPENPKDTKAGRLTYLGGLELTSNHPDFGGLSGLIVGTDGDALIAVSDQGNWFTADLVAEGERPTGLADALIAPMMNANGIPLSGKRNTDAESLTVAYGADPRTSPTIVSFERNHRLRSYDLTSLGFEAPAMIINDFQMFDDLENNGGLEAITYLPDGSLLALSEKTFDEDGYIIGAHLHEDGATPVRLKQHLPYALTDIAVLPNGDLITLERHFSPLAGVSMMMRQIPASALESSEPLDGEVLVEANHTRSIDNMEGLSVRTSDDGTTLLYLVSDDNFNSVQRTLLLVFALND